MTTSNLSTFNEKHSLGIRIWHWTFFILLAATMITVLFASTLFSTGNNIALVRDELQQKKVIVDRDQARAVAHALSDKLWELHTWIGYFIAVFLLGRFILEIFQPADEKLSNKIKKAMGFQLVSTEQKDEQLHYTRVKWGYVLFYGLILVMAITGLGLAFEDVPFFNKIRGPLKQIHSLIQWGIYGFVFIHLTGVIIAETGRYPGLVSGMLHGKKRV